MISLLLFPLAAYGAECGEMKKAKQCKDLEPDCHWQFDTKVCLTTEELIEKIKARPCADNARKELCDLNDKCEFQKKGGLCVQKSFCGDEDFQNACLNDFMNADGCHLTKEEIDALDGSVVNAECFECVEITDMAHEMCKPILCSSEDYQNQCMDEFKAVEGICEMSRSDIEALDGSVIDEGCYQCDVIRGMADDYCKSLYPTCIMEGKRTAGISLGVWTNVESVDACSSGCLANADCQVWTYFPMKQTCKLVGGWPKRGPARFKKGRKTMQSGTNECNNGVAVPLPEQ